MNGTARRAGTISREIASSEWRKPLLDVALRTGFGIGAIWFAAYLWTASELRISIQTGFLVVCLGLGGLAAFATKFPEGLRVAALQQLFVVPIIVSFLHIPPNANAGLCLALFVIVTALYHGLRLGIFAIVGVFILYLVTGWAWQSHILPLGTQLPSDPSRAVTWIRIGLGQIVGTGALVAIATYMVRHGLRVVDRLQRNEQFLRNVIDATNDGIWDWEIPTGVVTWSDRMYELLGQQRSNEPLNFEGILTLVHPEDQAPLREAIDAHLKTKALFDFEARFRRPNGTYGYFLCRGAAIRDVEGAPLHMVGSLGDVTERRLMHDALKGSEALLKQFVKHTPAAVAMFDPQLRYIQCSDRWLKDYRLGGQELAGRWHYEVFPSVPERWKDIHRRALAGATERCDEDPFPREDGTIDWLQWEVQPWHKPSGEIGGIIMFTQIITERKLAKQKITEQLTELQRWRRVTLGREQRSQQLKREVNELCRQLHLPPRYPATDADGEATWAGRAEKPAPSIVSGSNGE